MSKLTKSQIDGFNTISRPVPSEEKSTKRELLIADYCGNIWLKHSVLDGPALHLPRVCERVTDDWADLIVKSVNSHAELVDALKAVIARLNKGQDINTETRTMVEEAIKHASD